MAYNKQSDLSHINGGLPSTSSNNSKDEERLKKRFMVNCLEVKFYIKFMNYANPLNKKIMNLL
ncbi:hypothetical protein [Spiroplasma ixodetis]|uniref:Uncharacterized protein n=1 Tax=Spiroplasma ixodetis TaxID=2141 RepID=A0ABN6SXE6_9MOLU|nr:hypothetical protein [Spiroplasma ixodetis]BDT03277.1 hypothetical protein SHM_09230 [Spiroplasma ixodetis]